MRRVPFDELEEGNPHSSFIDVRHGGRPFTGVAVEEHPDFVSEYPYLEGAGHGRGCSTFRNGQLMEEFHLEHGEYVGESRRWNSAGVLREYERHDEPRLLQRWNDAGRLVEERNAATHREWYADGVLRQERSHGAVRVFAPDGRLAFSQAENGAVQFVAEVMASQCEHLVVHREFEPRVFAWVDGLLGPRRAEGVQVLQRLLAHEDLWVKAGALGLVGRREVVELEAAVRSLTSDLRLPAQQFHRDGGRAATRTIAAQAHDALGLLTRSRTPVERAP